jgi:hypothetical protein
MAEDLVQTDILSCSLHKLSVEGEAVTQLPVVMKFHLWGANIKNKALFFIEHNF